VLCRQSLVEVLEIWSHPLGMMYIELPAKPLHDFLRNNQSNINQDTHARTYFPGLAHVTRLDPVCVRDSFGVSPYALAGVRSEEPGVCGGRDMHICIHLHLHIYTYVYIYHYIYTRAYITHLAERHVHIYIHICIHLHMHIYTYVYHTSSRVPSRSFTRDVTRSECRHRHWLRSGRESHGCDVDGVM